VPVSALVGCQWGDEGKGKIVDILSERVEIVARYQGGANAGHTVVIGDETHILHLLPVGVLRPGIACVLGNGMVVDLDSLEEELTAVRAAGNDPSGRLFVSPGAHVVLPYHKAVERHRESTTAQPIGTTLRGIGPTYETKAGRIGLRIGDLYRPSVLTERLESLRAWALVTGCSPEEVAPVDEVRLALEAHAKRLDGHVRNVRAIIHEAIGRGAEVLLEGAQGTLLDLDHGTYPFVTSSSTSAAGTATGLGLPPHAVSRSIGVTKAYTTRVGEGPFPTEFDTELSESFRPRAGEFGATTGRPRRCGWLDGVLLRYAAELNGLTALVVTKLDVLDGFETLRVATAYEEKASGKRVDASDVDVSSLDEYTPVYEDLPGWTDSTTGVTSWKDLPARARTYLDRIAEIAGVPVAIASTGSRRNEVVMCRDELLPAPVATS